jgi:uncharacterized protein
MSRTPLSAVARFEIGCSDLRRSRAFYEGLFNWTVRSDNAIGYGFVEAGGEDSIPGGLWEDLERPPAVVIYIQVADVEQAVARAIELGARLVLPVTRIPGRIRFARIADPDNNIVGLIEGEW